MNLSGWFAAFDGVRRVAEDVRRTVARVTEGLPRIPQLPPTVFRCGPCGERVGRFTPRPDRPNFQVPTDFTCSKHGPLQDPDDVWLAEWERRGKPDRLTLRLPPV